MRTLIAFFSLTVALVAQTAVTPIKNAQLTGTVTQGVVMRHKPDGTVVIHAATADTNAARGTALEAARTAAAAGETIVVGPGGYVVTASLAKNEVDWGFLPGTEVTFDANSVTGIWDDGGAAMTYRVSGQGIFRRAYSGDPNEIDENCVVVSHADSDVVIEALDVIVGDAAGGGAGDQCAIKHTAGTLTVRARDVLAYGEDGTGILWTNGRLHATGRRCSGGLSGFWSKVDAAPTGDGHVNFDEIEAGIYALYSTGTNTDAAWWTRSNIVRSTSNPAITAIGGNRGYVETQKIFGQIWQQSGTSLLYVRADKISRATGYDSLALINGGTSFLQINHWDATGVAGASMTVTGGTVDFLGGAFVGAAGTNGVSVSGGTARLRGMRITTTANNATNPVTKSGGTLVLEHCTLIAEATRDSISAASAQTVSLLGCWANTALDADVTNNITSGLSVDADVN